jgi:lipopolysaccharide/colanic/teichoic acid biosynthesis glycosyltransferase
VRTVRRRYAWPPQPREAPHDPELDGERSRREAIGEGARRVLNVAVALVGLVLAAPLMGVIAVLVKLSSPGPVLFRQPRVGLDRRAMPAVDADLARRRKDMGGRVFTMYKFRTMRNGADRAGEIWASPQDPRVTAIGRVLRQYRLDELPQLYNVLRGEMNIVGPRPEQPQIFAQLREKVNGYTERQKVLPGITGLAQVKRPYDQSLEDVRIKVELDLDYLGRRSPGQDLKIMLQTIPVMLNRKGWL